MKCRMHPPPKKNNLKRQSCQIPHYILGVSRERRVVIGGGNEGNYNFTDSKGVLRKFEVSAIQKNVRIRNKNVQCIK